MLRKTPSLSACVLAVALGSAATAAGARAAANFHIRGGGDGHGVGMSQYGAYGYALHGADYRSILAHYYKGTALGVLSPGHAVRVLLATAPTASFSGADAVSGVKVKPGQSYTLKLAANGQLALVSAQHKVLAKYVGGPVVASGPGPLLLAGKGLYRGNIQFQSAGGGIDIVNAVGLEDYVRGVVAMEMPSSWSATALEVQAVAARTYAITTSAGGVAFDQYADTRSQVYGGVAGETASTDAAVAATSGQVVTYQGTPVATYFSSSSGGQTENIEAVWQGIPPDPWLRGVSDPYDSAGGNPNHMWRRDMSAAAAVAKLHGLVKGRFEGIEVIRHGVSPRVITAKVVGSGGSTVVTGSQLQARFGLLSTYASFTTISTRVGTAATQPSAGVGVGGSGPGSGGVGTVASIRPQLSGRVFPAAAGAGFTVQASSGGHWHTVESARLGSGGTYSVTVPSTGTYRLVYQGLGGPAVTAS
jgi:stage II sporulation protein D